MGEILLLGKHPLKSLRNLFSISCYISDIIISDVYSHVSDFEVDLQPAVQLTFANSVQGFKQQAGFGSV